MRPDRKTLELRAEKLQASIENYQPKTEDFDAPLPPEMALRLAAWRRAQDEKNLAEAVSRAREARLSWNTIGAAIGTSGEAARQRYA